MKIVVIKSDYSEVPLAEIRTDGRVLDFVVDNTDGKLPKMFENSYAKMTEVVRKSSHMQMEEPQKATVNLLRYLMDNGDVVEITSDGHTVILNGKLLSPEEKDAMFAAVKRGDIKVARKTDISQALPILPAAQQQSAPAPQVKLGMNQNLLNIIQKEQAEADKNKRLASKQYDQDIENAQLHEAEDEDWTRKFMYWLKYGDDNG